MPPQGNPRLQAVLQALASHPELDRQAVLSVFGQEGLSGGVGDGGHAFGPAQLNDAGGVLTGKLPGASVGQKQAWAWSPQGLQYALAGISKVAAGRRGPDAVNAIVSGFERPANPQREIAGALSAYGGQSSASLGADGGSAAPSVSSSTAGAGADQRQVFARALLGGGRLDSHAVLNALLAARQAVPENAATPGMATPTAGTAATPAGGNGTLAELLHEGVGGPTHSTGEHIHVASRDPQTELGAIALAQQLGLSARENPYTGDTVDPVHAPHSFHNVDFPGLYNGRKLGEAVDVSGNPKLMQKFYALIQQRYGR